ncbi:hypothetical protein U1Q18_036818 [Sarracenia purpurea var. burkii]
MVDQSKEVPEESKAAEQDPGSPIAGEMSPSSGKALSQETSVLEKDAMLAAHVVWYWFWLKVIVLSFLIGGADPKDSSRWCAGF